MESEKIQPRRVVLEETEEERYPKREIGIFTGVALEDGCELMSVIKNIEYGE